MLTLFDHRITKMLFTVILLMLGMFMTTALTNPVMPRNDQSLALQIREQVELDNGTVTFHGKPDQDGTRRLTADISPAGCGSSPIECLYGGHPALKSGCDQLFGWLKSAPDREVPLWATDACWDGQAELEGQHCCITWWYHNPGLVNSMLFSILDSFLNECTFYDFESKYVVGGKSDLVILAGNCQPVCLSAIDGSWGC
ncbi:hypothetical protein F4778DRAFT_403031 [Xylariomycetidae sp. FL2044]|nr:hypothetical protein F4778DRAFT_403031 [Xylariomycetidae sp. FL2044]